MTAAALLAEAGAVLARAGVPSPERDAERLVRHVTGWDRARLLARPEAEVEGADEERFRELVRRRASREPLQYVLGIAAFWKHDFVVTPAVLIPKDIGNIFGRGGLLEHNIEFLPVRLDELSQDLGRGPRILEGEYTDGKARLRSLLLLGRRAQAEGVAGWGGTTQE